MSVGNIVLGILALAALAVMAYFLWKTREAKRAVDARMAQQRRDDEVRRIRLIEQQRADRQLRTGPVQPYQVTAHNYETAPRVAKPKPRPAASRPAPKPAKRRSSSDSGYSDYSGSSFIDYSDYGSSSASSSDSGSSSSYSSYDSGSSSSSSDSGSSGGGSCD